MINQIYLQILDKNSNDNSALSAPPRENKSNNNLAFFALLCAFAIKINFLILKIFFSFNNSRTHNTEADTAILAVGIVAVTVG